MLTISVTDQFTPSGWVTADIAIVAVVISGLAAYYARRSASAAERSATAAEKSAAAAVRQADVAERTAKHSDRVLDKRLLRLRAEFHDAAKLVLAKFVRVRRILSERREDQMFSGKTISVEELRELKLLAGEAEIAFEFDLVAARDAMQPVFRDDKPFFSSENRRSDLLALDRFIAVLERSVRESGAL